MYKLNEQYKPLVEEAMTESATGVSEADYRENVTAKVVENQIKFLQEASADQVNVTGSGIANFDPVLVKMVRRSTPKMMAFDLAGVQPMSGPTGSIFAIRPRYTNQTGAEAFYNEADTAHSGKGAHSGDTSGFGQDFFAVGDPAADPTTGEGMTTAELETLGTVSGGTFNEMAFSIERADVSAVGRALKAEYSRELAHDLRQIHGLDAEAELANILSTEITAEQDRELLRKINVSAVLGANAGKFDLQSDADGRWLVERWKGLIFQLELEANAVARTTRRGKANRVVCSANVASAMAMAGVLEYNPKLAVALNVDETANTYAGMLLGRYAVYIDPYTAVDYITVAYRGSNAWDAGIYYCPYVGLELMRATGEDSFQPKIGFKTRYGMIANPFARATAQGGVKAGEGFGAGENDYFRKFAVLNLGA